MGPSCSVYCYRDPTETSRKAREYTRGTDPEVLIVEGNNKMTAKLGSWFD